MHTTLQLLDQVERDTLHAVTIIMADVCVICWDQGLNDKSLFFSQFKVQQSPQTAPQLLQLLLQQQQQQQQQQQLQPKPQMVTPQQPQYSPTTQPVSNQGTILQQLLQHLGVWPAQQSSPVTPQQVVVTEEQLSPQQQVPSPVSVSSQSTSTPGSPHQPSSPIMPVHLSAQPISPQTQQVSGFTSLRGFQYKIIKVTGIVMCY